MFLLRFPPRGYIYQGWKSGGDDYDGILIDDTDQDEE